MFMPNALVTGPSSGIGRATALELARRGFHIVAAGRSAERTRPVIDRIQAGDGSAEFLELDLASLDATREAARMFEATGRTLDVLVNNAGVGGTMGKTSDGFEIHFGVNHLGHFMLTHHLRRTFRPGTRIVQVTSAAHFNAEGIDFDRVQRSTRSLFGWKEYGVSKLANVLFARELARRQPDWRTYAVHPGMTNTNIFPRLIRPLLRNRLRSPEQGADTVVWCSTSADVADESGLYYRRRESRPPSEAAQDEDLARELWVRSERWCGVGPID
jgi:NAD(P)-dependent dehydrogenase (short-subunit alcohol dehydrogenase family)